MVRHKVNAEMIVRVCYSFNNEVKTYILIAARTKCFNDHCIGKEFENDVILSLTTQECIGEGIVGNIGAYVTRDVPL
ncbi:hypothetical protein ABE15_21885 [Bacillus cereus]|nr:hypothetical protein [Bacillus cereus]